MVICLLPVRGRFFAAIRYLLYVSTTAWYVAKCLHPLFFMPREMTQASVNVFRKLGVLTITAPLTPPPPRQLLLLVKERAINAFCQSTSAGALNRAASSTHVLLEKETFSDQSVCATAESGTAVSNILSKFFITAMVLRSERCDMASLCAGSQARHSRPGTPVRSVDAGGVSPRRVGERKEGGGGAYYPNQGVPRLGDLFNLSVHGIDFPLGSYKCCSPGCPGVSPPTVGYGRGLCLRV